jgi:16S rRNA U1498 N3-methylase RsmE
MIHKDDAILALRPGASFKTVDGVVEWLDETLTEPTADQITAKYNELVAAEPLNEVRVVRNRLLAETDWVVTMHKELGTNIPAAMKSYRAALRDITDSATSLDDVTWPEKP